MKKKALATKMAAFVMAGAMTMAMGFPAFAALDVTPDGNDQKYELTKTIKYVNDAEGKVREPKTQFNFNVTTADAITIKNGTESIYVYAGLAGGVTLEGNRLDIAPGATNTYTTNVVLHKNVFTKPGAYHYLLSEEATPAYDGMVNATYKYDIYVFVDKDNKVNMIATKREGDNAIKEFNDIGTEKASRLEFENTYTTHNLTVEKQVTGNQGDKSKSFEFLINIDGAAGEEYNYEICKVDTNTHVGDGIIKSDEGQKSITLTDNQKIIIYGLSANDTYSVEETSYASEGYKTTVDGKETLVTGETTMGTTNRNIVYVNNKTISTPTGIVTEYAPYILLVAAAGAFAVLFLRRKKEEF